MFSLIIYNNIHHHHQHHHQHHPDLSCPQLLACGVAGVGSGLPLVPVVLPPAPRHHVTKVQQFVLQSYLDEILLCNLAIVISYF